MYRPERNLDTTNPRPQSSGRREQSARDRGRWGVKIAQYHFEQEQRNKDAQIAAAKAMKNEDEKQRKECCECGKCKECKKEKVIIEVASKAGSKAYYSGMEKKRAERKSQMKQRIKELEGMKFAAQAGIEAEKRARRP